MANNYRGCVGRADGLITMYSGDLSITEEIDISIDSIFDADTVTIAAATGLWDNEVAGILLESLGDTVLTRADTTSYNDTLWIQNSYVFTDTLNVYEDSSFTIESESFESLLLNVNTGDLYDINRKIWNTGSSDEGYQLKALSIFDYDPESDKVYFEISENELGRLDLNTLSLEIENLPYPLMENGHRTWAGGSKKC